jgi:hypothetical protein
MRVRTQERIVFLHVGTHKTGSTALQYFLKSNEVALAAAGIYVLKTGRLAPHPQGCGHHNVAFELTESLSYHEPLGTFADLLEEISCCGLSRVCISSEEFEILHHKPANMQLLHEAFANIGFHSKIIVYLRPQVDYLESLYAELLRGGWFVDFSTCLHNSLTPHGTIFSGNVTLAYERLVNTFADGFGTNSVIVRPYRRAANPAFIQREFARIVCLSKDQLHSCIMTTTRRINKRLTFGETITALRAASDGHSFDPTVNRCRPISAARRRARRALPPSSTSRGNRHHPAVQRRKSPAVAALSSRARCISRRRLADMLQDRLHPKRAQAKRRRLLESLFVGCATGDTRSRLIVPRCRQRRVGRRECVELTTNA